jgi:hypothetical protein
MFRFAAKCPALPQAQQAALYNSTAVEPSLLGRMFRFASKCPALPQAQQAALYIGTVVVPSLLGRMFRFAAKSPALPQAQQAALYNSTPVEPSLLGCRCCFGRAELARQDVPLRLEMSDATPSAASCTLQQHRCRAELARLPLLLL